MPRRPPAPIRPRTAKRRAETRARKASPAGFNGPAAYTRDPESRGLLPTFLQFPTRPLNGRTMEDREDAILATYSGRLRELIDLGRLLISEDGFQQGLLDTMSHGLIGMPLSFQGEPTMCEALLDAAGTPGEYGRMHPENEAAKILADGIVFNHGLGQYVFDEEDLERQIGEHRVPRLVWRDPRWLRRDPYSLQWYFHGRGGEVPINPGDGEWVLFQPYPDTDAWRHGPVLYMTLAAIFSRDTLFDRQRISETCAPTRIARAIKPTTPKARAKMAADIAKMAHDNQITLDHEWIYEVISAAAGDWWKVCSEIVTWARQMVEVGLTGNILSVEGPTGFSNADVYRRVTDSRRRFYANAWTRCIRDQGLTWWVRDNYGEVWVKRTPVPVYNVESPEDAMARAGALKAWGESIKACAEGIGAAGVELEPAYVIEVLQRAGIRARATSSPRLGLEPAQLAAVIRGNVALASLGLPTFPAGDPRGDMTLAALLEAAKAPSAPAPQAPPAGDPPPVLPAGAPPAPTARVEEEDRDDDGDEEDSARLATEYTRAGLDRCPYHGRTHACARCGVRRIYGLDPATNAPRVAWRPLRAALVAPHQEAA